MDELTLQFFDAHPGALPLYEAFETRVTDLVPDVRIKVLKTQISFYNRHLFACVSFARIRKRRTARTIISLSHLVWNTRRSLQGSTLPPSRIRIVGHIMC